MHDIFAQKGPAMTHAEQFDPRQQLDSHPPSSGPNGPQMSDAELEAYSPQIDSFLPRSPLFWLDYARLNVRRKVYELKVVNQEY
jgi:hypothetical protein